MKNLKISRLLPAALVLMLSVLAASAQPPQPQTRSVESSPTSVTRVSEQPIANSEKLLSACNAAADELRASRDLIDALEAENASLRSRIDTEKRANELLTELNEAHRAETEALKFALAAKNETLNTKDLVIDAQDKLIATLKTKKRSPWSRVADVAIGAAIGIILR